MYAIFDKTENRWYCDDFLTDTYFNTNEHLRGFPVFKFKKDAKRYLKRFDKSEPYGLEIRPVELKVKG